jgi:hypothetical protein
MSVNRHTTRASQTTDPMRRMSLVAGILYLITFVSIPTLALYRPFQDDVGAFVQGAGTPTSVLWGVLSEVIVGLAGIGTAVVLFPLLKRQSETAALGFVASRILEASLIFVGVASLLSMVSLRNGLEGTAAADSGSLAAGQSLLGVYNGAFLVSQSLMPVINDLLLGYVLYRSALVPRFLPIIAFIGAPLLLASDIAILFGAYDRTAPISALLALPIAVFEFILGVWLVVKGFNRSSPLFAGSHLEGGGASRADTRAGGAPH